MIKEGEYINKKDIIDLSYSVFSRNKDTINQLIIDTNNKEESLPQMYNEDFIIDSKLITMVTSPYTVYSGTEDFVTLFKRKIDSSFLERLWTTFS